MPGWYEFLTSTPGLLAAGALSISTALLIRSRSKPGATSQQASEVARAATNNDSSKSKMAQAAASVMSPPATSLEAPRDDPISAAELSRYDGTDPDKPVYVAIKGKVFDVSSKREMYGAGGSYHVFAGKDASKGLGMSSLDLKDAVPDYSSLNPAQRKTLDQWESFFEKRYNIVGKVHP